jgi:hypothetical protein
MSVPSITGLKSAVWRFAGVPNLGGCPRPMVGVSSADDVVKNVKERGATGG